MHATHNGHIKCHDKRSDVISYDHVWAQSQAQCPGFGGRSSGPGVRSTEPVARGPGARARARCPVRNKNWTEISNFC